MCSALATAREYATYVMRDPPKYLPGALGMYAAPLKFGVEQEIGPGYRAMYAFSRAFDDIVDRDRPYTPTDKYPTRYEYLQAHVYACETGDFSRLTRDPLATLAQEGIAFLESRPQAQRGVPGGPGSISPRGELSRLMREMIFDARRVDTGWVLDEANLGLTHFGQFRAIHRLQKLALDTQMTDRQIDLLSHTQSQVYSAIDLEQDLGKGMIEIPKEVLVAGGLMSSDKSHAQITYAQAIQSPQVQDWLTRIRTDNAPRLARLRTDLLGRQGSLRNRPLAAFYTDRLLRKMEHFCEPPQEDATRGTIFDRARQGIGAVKEIGIAESVHGLQAAHYGQTLGERYRTALEISPHTRERTKKGGYESEVAIWHRKIRNLALCYIGFAQGTPTRQQIEGAGKAAMLSVAYDVASDWRNKGDLQWRQKLDSILRAEVSPRLADMAIQMFDRDVAGKLESDGLERGVTSLEFILESMGVKKVYEGSTDVHKLGLMLQVSDDILDLSDDEKNGDENCLLTPRRHQWLQEYTQFMTDETIQNLFPHAGVLGLALRRARAEGLEILSRNE